MTDLSHLKRTSEELPAFDLLDLAALGAAITAFLGMVFQDIPSDTEIPGVVKVGKRLYAQCAKCGGIVRVNKPVIGSLHICAGAWAIPKENDG